MRKGGLEPPQGEPHKNLNLAVTLMVEVMMAGKEGANGAFELVKRRRGR